MPFSGQNFGMREIKLAIKSAPEQRVKLLLLTAQKNTAINHPDIFSWFTQ